MTKIEPTTERFANCETLIKNARVDLVARLVDGQLIWRTYEAGLVFYAVSAAEAEAKISDIEKENATTATRKAKARAKALARRAACTRCGGSGKLPGYEHIEGGRCFKCR